MKSFEIVFKNGNLYSVEVWTINLKSFEITVANASELIDNDEL